mmetsp:Transcript_18027/g.69767  ORF Transcript_18027/g.69767 Transcript_18027/m.69767 type:complete len:128 (-) Transcript_18027:49-432(-)
MVKYVFFSEHESADASSVYDEKYIIAEVAGGDETEYHFVTMALQYHSQIAQSYGRRLDMVDGKRIKEVHGGGIVKIRPDEKLLHTYGRSGGYGPPDLDQVRTVLLETLVEEDAGWVLDLTVTTYIRG